MINIKDLEIKDLEIYKALTLYEIFGTKKRKWFYIIFAFIMLGLLFIGGLDALRFVIFFIVIIFSLQFLMRFSLVSYKYAKKIKRFNFDLKIIDNFLIIKFRNDNELKKNNMTYYFKYPILDIKEFNDCFIILLSRIGGDALPQSNTVTSIICLDKKYFHNVKNMKEMSKIQYSTEFYKNYYNLDKDFNFHTFMLKNMKEEEKKYEDENI